MAAINPAFLGTLISRVNLLWRRGWLHECMCVYVCVCLWHMNVVTYGEKERALLV